MLPIFFAVLKALGSYLIYFGGPGRGGKHSTNTYCLDLLLHEHEAKHCPSASPVVTHSQQLYEKGIALK